MRFHFIILSCKIGALNGMYYDGFEPQKIESYRGVCHQFARATARCREKKKKKIHLILHLPDSMLRFGPASSFNTER